MDENKKTDIALTLSKPSAPQKAPQKAIALTKEAAEQIKYLLTRACDDKQVLRLGVENAGCVGMRYRLDYITEPDAIDEVIEDKGVKIAISPKALMFLFGTVMDYRMDDLSENFVFDNPNQIDQCGCGESVQLKPSQIIMSAEKS